jgi:GAF domain-containing protein
VTEESAPRLIDALHDRAHTIAERTAADACVLSRVVGDVLIIVVQQTVDGERLELGQGFLVSDYPATKRVLDTGEPTALTLHDDGVDEAEARLLRELGFGALLMAPLELAGERWGLVEVYRTLPAAFDERDVAATVELARIA